MGISGRTPLMSICFMTSTILPRSTSALSAGFAVIAPQRRARDATFSSVPSKRHATMSTDVEIQSLKNHRVKEARGLLRRRQREKENRIILEGKRLISDALEAGVQAHHFFFTQEALDRAESNHALRKAMRERGSSESLVSDAVIRSFSETVNPQGLVAVFERPDPVLPPSPSLILICDEIRDPGNVGALLRSAAGAGVHAVAMTPGCADVWSLKALRAGMGAQFRLPVKSGMTWTEIAEYCGMTKSTLRVAEGSAKLCYTQVDWALPSALVIGSEAEGPSAAAFAACDEQIGIPLSQGMESLNAAMAGAIILFEARRQRALEGVAE